jgi:DUF1680 family protein
MHLRQGFAVLSRTFAPGDTVELDMAMPVTLVEAHPEVVAARDRVAIQRGPIVYGVEGIDNRGETDLLLAHDPAFETEHWPDHLGGVTTIAGLTAEGQRFRAIPFYALANRGPSRQEVWLRQQGATTDPTGWEGKLYRRKGS